MLTSGGCGFVFFSEPADRLVSVRDTFRIRNYVHKLTVSEFSKLAAAAATTEKFILNVGKMATEALLLLGRNIPGNLLMVSAKYFYSLVFRIQI